MKYGYSVIILAITGFMMYDTYYDGKYLKLAKSWTKYYKMAGYAFVGFSLFFFLKKNPEQAQDFVGTANTMIKYMPIDKNTTAMLSPIMNAINPTSKAPQEVASVAKITSSGKKATKRSVSETKKKYVAAQQSWICNKCKKQLPAWFEVDHKIRLEYGGSNHVDNLEALCRDCHGRKTSMENL